MKNPILVCDGMNVFMRHFCANPSMSDNGEHVGGFLGFLKGLGILCEQFNPSRLIVVWESGGNVRRRAIAGSYKMGRRPATLNRYYEDDIPATVSNHTMQISLLVKALGNLPITQIYVKDCEADDVIGYIARYILKDTETIVVSSDKDLHQLIGDRVVQYSPGQKKIIDKQTVIEKFGISPTNFVTARCFVGDNSDNVSGVKGAGFKNISKWFTDLAGDEFISCEQLVEQATELAKQKRSKTIKAISESKELAKKNWKLMHLDTSSLSADQIQKINGQLENTGKSDKMSLLRLMSQQGMLNFDVDRHFTAINSVRYR